MKYYKVSEEDLVYLLESEARYNALERGGVDNWSYFWESNGEYLDSKKEEYEVYGDDKYFDFESLARLELDEYEEIKKDV